MNHTHLLRYLIFSAGILLVASGCQRTRVEKTYHPNGKTASEVEYKGSLKHGKAVWYYEDGRKEVEYSYREGELEGTVTRWYFNGNIEFREAYSGNLLHGTSEYFFITGKLSEEKHYREGTLHGLYLLNWENGSAKIRGNYAHGLFDGKWEYFDEKESKVGEASFQQGSGTMTGYHKNGKISRVVPYQNNLKQGKEQVYDESGTLTEELVYEKGELVGKTYAK
ncbi:MAG TPA: toxin-antitoxin system YwqK family antitoxin [Bacteroidales bacterium]|nr:toxin-antitoxin system YwqK family antitoxin [Bacteroidales bacterium]HRZ49960.1 toxin-antitoxin system YwqK family antitoxin [Bacteroidales bacterium]